MSFEYTDAQLNNLHEILTMMLEDIKRVCDKNNIRYFISYGTLIGAVRHNGFIPWDDDLDIAILRKDYERFVKLPSSEFKYGMFIEDCVNTEGYGHVFAKVMLPGTTNAENFTKNVKCAQNIYIDVFPLDYTTNKRIALKIQHYMCLFYARLMLLNCKYKYTKTGVKKVVYSIGYFIASKCSKKKLYSKWLKWATKYSDTKCNVKSMAAIYRLDRELMPVELFKESKDYDFEGHKFSAVADYDKYLKIIYGNYMKLPPVEQRVAKHNSYKVDFGPYEMH